jgi:phenylalanyl-tRNA synthetase alpha chain
MRSDLEAVLPRALADISSAENKKQLQNVRIKYTGKKGILTQFLRRTGSLAPEERPVIGRLANNIKGEVEEALRRKEEEIRQEEEQKKIESEAIDWTLPGRPQAVGKIHPVSKVQREICHIFNSLGFEVAEGTEVENCYYNFEALNIPEDHPARDMHDTFYLQQDGLILRTHTSPVQIHTMEKYPPPVRIIAPGKVYRCDSDLRHSPMFHQVEGLLVDEGINFGDLKGTLEYFVHRMFGRNVALRFRPSYFPFTEPSAEIDIACVLCSGSGCRTCSQSGWLEILGAGMVDPAVFEKVGYDPESTVGFAFGMGVERIAMIKYGIDDIRLFFENDLRFLKQF